MKKLFTFILIMMFPATFLLAQEYEFYQYLSGNWVKIPNGSTITRSCYINSDGIDEFFGVKNISTGSRMVWARKQQHNKTPEVTDSYCWNGCMQPYDSLSYKFLKMDPGMMTTNQFEIHFRPGSKTGNTLISYSFFDRSYLSDSGYIQIIYNITPMGINEPSWVNKPITASPNPASSFIRFSGIPESFIGYLTISNIVGQEITHIPINLGHQEITFNCLGIQKGIYFYFLSKNGVKGPVSKILIGL